MYTNGPQDCVVNSKHQPTNIVIAVFIILCYSGLFSKWAINSLWII